MPLFRRKREEVRAEQYDPPAHIPLGVHEDVFGCRYVETSRGDFVYLEDGDWIVPEPGDVTGRFYYPVRDADMKLVYDQVSELQPAHDCGGFASRLVRKD
jgi:hypothetical protein